MEKEENVQGCAAGCDSCAGCGEHENSEQFSPIVTLTDEDGKDVKFEILDVVVLDDEKEYLVVAEAGEKEEESDVEVTILGITEEDGEEVYDTVIDEDLAKKVFDEFVKQQADMEEVEEELDSEDEE
ncbi:MAG: DUF1292 domain-containing protein [Clostridia bacterium]